MSVLTSGRRGLSSLSVGLFWLLLWAPAVAREPPATAVMPAPALRLAGGLLSVNVSEMTLVEVLGELSRQGGFVLAPCAACKQRISLRFDRLPLDQGLALILRDQNFALRWQVAPGAGLMPQQLWLLPLVAGQQITVQAVNQARVPAPPAGQQAVRSPPTPPRLPRQPSALDIGTPQERADAAVAMARSRQPGTVAALAQALADSDRQVRQSAIESLAEIGGAEAVSALALALRDVDARLREAAVNALGDVGGSKAIVLLRQAQHDASPFVRQAASETLADLAGKKP